MENTITVFWKNAVFEKKIFHFILFNSYLCYKRQTFLATTFIKCAHVQSLLEIVCTTTCKSRDILSHQEDNIKM